MLLPRIAPAQLFQSTFIKILYPGASILLTLEWTLLNSAVSLVRPAPAHYLSSCMHAWILARTEGAHVSRLMWRLVAAQVGYYFSAFTVDRAWMGRVRLQSMVCAFSCARRS